jgi:hypothetical protein
MKKTLNTITKLYVMVSALCALGMFRITVDITEKQLCPCSIAPSPLNTRAFALCCPVGLSDFYLDCLLDLSLFTMVVHARTIVIQCFTALSTIRSYVQIVKYM